MTDAQAVTGAVGGVVVGAGGVVVGMHVDALVLGIIAALCVTTWLGSFDSRLKVAAAALFSGLLAAYSSPVAADYVAANYASVAHDPAALRIPMALVIGGIVPLLFPVLIRVLGGKLGGAQ